MNEVVRGVFFVEAGQRGGRRKPNLQVDSRVTLKILDMGASLFL
jgi:hypothetical protein